MHAVVANILSTRKERVLVIHQSEELEPLVTDIRKPEQDKYIEKRLVNHVVRAHMAFAQRGTGS